MKTLAACQICSDGVGKAVNGEPFIACDVCAFPVCRPCYEYERKDGNQSCSQCKTRYKRHKGRDSSKTIQRRYMGKNAGRDSSKTIQRRYMGMSLI